MSWGITPDPENTGFSCDGMGSPRDAPGKCWTAERLWVGFRAPPSDLWPPLMLDPQRVCESQ